MKKIIVAIDGFSSCGKSTIAKELANYAGYIYVDTGAMYRAVSLFAIRGGGLTPRALTEEGWGKHLEDWGFRLGPKEQGRSKPC